MHHPNRQQSINDIIGMLHRMKTIQAGWQTAGKYGIKRRLAIAIVRSTLAIFRTWIRLTLTPSPGKARLLQAMEEF